MSPISIVKLEPSDDNISVLLDFDDDGCHAVELSNLSQSSFRSAQSIPSRLVCK